MATKVATSIRAISRLNGSGQFTPLLPFLYQTRTIQRASEAADSHRRSIATSSQRPTDRRVSKASNDFDNGVDDINDRVNATAEDDDEDPFTSSNPRKLSTITDTEQQTFARIFKEIVSSSAYYPARGQENRDDLEPAKSARKSGEHSSDLDAIFLSAVQDAKDRPGPRGADRDESIIERIDGISAQSPPSAANGNELGALATGEQPANERDNAKREYLQQALMRYPESLRAAAAEAAGFRPQKTRPQALSSSEVSPVLQESAELDAEVEAVRQRELVRIEHMLIHAESGVEIIRILERELFPLLSQLEDPPPEATPNSRGKKKKPPRPRSKKVTASAQAIGLDPEHEQPQAKSIPPLAILGINYPHLLLLATRLLRNVHHTPTLALSLFARIKSLSPISYVLGATTALYNEILKVRWYDSRDFWGVDELLLEMERGGVDFDARTEAILREANAERRVVERGEMGQWKETLWAIEGGRGAGMRLRLWKELVSTRVQELSEKQLDIDLVE
ncbi:MAG: hypothetical protein M1837_004874 [Sclerophora amabilis]|nr:MAG: hypothetical protein M1837_004874 [Sclerophora amabilis]